LAIGGHLQAGAIVSLALLLTRLYAPLTALANTSNTRSKLTSATGDFNPGVGQRRQWCVQPREQQGQRYDRARLKVTADGQHAAEP